MATSLLSLLCAAALLGLPVTAAPLSFPEGQVLQLRAVAAGGSLQVLPLPQGRSLGDFAADEPAHVNYDPKFSTDGWCVGVHGGGEQARAASTRVCAVCVRASCV